MAYKYYMFSSKQLKMNEDAMKRIGKAFSPSRVRAKGVWKSYTEAIADPNNSRYSDARVVAEGEESEMTVMKGDFA
jgi:hypothetical protein